MDLIEECVISSLVALIGLENSVLGQPILSSPSLGTARSLFLENRSPHRILLLFHFILYSQQLQACIRFHDSKGCCSDRDYKRAKRCDSSVFKCYLLHRFNHICYATCKRCHGDTEMDHLVFTCPKVAESGLTPLPLFLVVNLWVEAIAILASQGDAAADSERKTVITYLLWSIGSQKHGDLPRSPLTILTSGAQPDGSVHQHGAGIGFITRDFHGRVLHAAAAPIESTSIPIVELTDAIKGP